MTSTEPEDILRLERQVDVCRLRKEGWSYREIGAKLGISDDTARRDVIASIRAIEWTRAEEALEVRQMAIDRNHDAMKAIYEKIIAGDVGAIDRLIRLNEQLLDIVGGRAPTSIDVTSDGKPVAAPISTIEVTLTHERPGTPSPDEAAEEPLRD